MRSYSRAAMRQEHDLHLLRSRGLVPNGRTVHPSSRVKVTFDGFKVHHHQGAQDPRRGEGAETSTPDAAHGRMGELSSSAAGTLAPRALVPPRSAPVPRRRGSVENVEIHVHCERSRKTAPRAQRMCLPAAAQRVVAIPVAPSRSSDGPSSRSSSRPLTTGTPRRPSLSRGGEGTR